MTLLPMIRPEWESTLKANGFSRGLAYILTTATIHMERTTATGADVVAEYYETETERVLSFESEGTTAAIAQNRDGYAMLKVRTASDGDELERYYGFDMALDHVGEVLGISPSALPVPDAAQDMGM